MRNDVASSVNIGDLVYNCFMEPLIVVNKMVYTEYNNPQFSVKDRHGDISHYSCENLYLSDLEDEDDAEKAWVNWAKNNKDFCETFDHIETIREIYRTGFADGFEYRRNVTHKEQMQK